LVSVELLKEPLDLARDVVTRENAVPPMEEDRGKVALTEFFEDVKNGDTPIMVERVVNDIDEIVRHVRLEGWQGTNAGERDVKKALRNTLFKYRLHRDTDLFERAYGYIEEYY
jgi:type I restriction enzyme R subunit